MKTVTIQAVRFNCITGEPRIVEVQAELRNDENLGRVVQIVGGTTGYESFCLDLGSLKDRKESFSRMKSKGWWACAGTDGRWDAFYIHGLQMAKLIRELGI